MKLSKKQKNFILKNYNFLSDKEMASYLSIPISDVEKFLKGLDLRIYPNNLSKKTEKTPKDKKVLIFGSFDYKTLKEVILENHKFFLIVFLFITILMSRGFWGILLSDELTMYEDIKKLEFSLLNFFGTASNHYISFLLFGDNPIGNRVLTLILHFINIFLFFYVFRNFINEKVLKISILILSVHSLLVEPLVWVAANPYVYHALMYLLIIFFSLKFERTGKWYFLIPYYGLILNMTLSGTHTTFAPIFPIIFNLFILKRNFKKELMLSGWTLFLIPIYPFLNRGTVTSRVESLTTGPYLEKFLNTIPFTVTKTLELLVLPVNLALFHEETINPEYYTFARIFTLAFIVFSIWLFVKNKFMFGLYALGFAFCLYIFSPVQISWFVAERYSYLTVFFVCVLISMFLFKLREKFRYLGEILLILYLSLLFFVTIDRFNAWDDSIVLWERNVKISPDSYRVRNNLAENYSRIGRYSDAEIHYIEAVKRNPEFNEAYLNLANNYLKQNNLKEAEELFQFLLSRNFQIPNMLSALSILTANRGDFSLSYNYINKALEIDPNSEYIKSLELEIKNYELTKKN
jgi:hypothetical protein